MRIRNLKTGDGFISIGVALSTAAILLLYALSASSALFEERHAQENAKTNAQTDLLSESCLSAFLGLRARSLDSLSPGTRIPLTNTYCVLDAWSSGANLQATTTLRVHTTAEGSAILIEGYATACSSDDSSLCLNGWRELTSIPP
jgi:hypothetical protein